jgi:hypothetical protein
MAKMVGMCSGSIESTNTHHHIEHHGESMSGKSSSVSAAVSLPMDAFQTFPVPVTITSDALVPIFGDDASMVLDECNRVVATKLEKVDQLGKWLTNQAAANPLPEDARFPSRFLEDFPRVCVPGNNASSANVCAQVVTYGPVFKVTVKTSNGEEVSIIPPGRTPMEQVAWVEELLSACSQINQWCPRKEISKWTRAPSLPTELQVELPWIESGLHLIDGVGFNDTRLLMYDHGTQAHDGYCVIVNHDGCMRGEVVAGVSKHRAIMGAVLVAAQGRQKTLPLSIFINRKQHGTDEIAPRYWYNSADSDRRMAEDISRSFRSKLIELAVDKGLVTERQKDALIVRLSVPCPCMSESTPQECVILDRRICAWRISSSSRPHRRRV